MKERDYIQMREDTMKAHPKGKPLTAEGQEIPSPIPVAPPPGYRKPLSMFEEMRRVIREEKVRAALESEGFETPEEADDFDIEDEDDPKSPYEHNFDPVADPAELERLRNLGSGGSQPPVSSSSSAQSSGAEGGGGGGGSSQNAPPTPPASPGTKSVS